MNQGYHAQVNGINDENTCVVIGAGLVGLCTALAFQRQGMRVMLVDKGQPSQGASYGNAGFLATELVDPLGTLSTLKQAPKLLLQRHGPLAVPLGNLHNSLPWMSRFALSSLPDVAARGREALSLLNRQALTAWNSLLTRENLQRHLVPSGYLRIWESAKGKSAARAEAAFLRQWGIKAVPLTAAEITDMEPYLSRNVGHALYFPDSCRVSDPYWLAEALFNAFIGRGGEFHQMNVAAVIPVGNSFNVQGDKQVLHARHALICAGAKSAELLAPLGFQIPLMAERGYHLSLENECDLLRRPVCSAERNVFINPLSSGLRIVGISELGGTALPPNPRRYATLRHHACALIPSADAKLKAAKEWMGMRPTLPDSLPVIDIHPDYPGLGFAFGHQHLGLTLAAVTAELIVSRMLSVPGPDYIHQLSISRFKRR